MKVFKCEINARMFRGVSDCTGKCIFNLLKAFNLCERKSMLRKVTIVKTKVDEGSGDSGGCVKIKSVMNATEVTNLVMAGARKGGNLFGKS